MNRRDFLKSVAAVGLVAKSPELLGAGLEADEEVGKAIEAARPSRLKALPADFKARVGATHVDGKYYLTDKPFLVEGAEKLLELGTRLGKFYFSPSSAAREYSFNSQWPRCRDFVELAKTDYWQRVFAMPFSTLIFQAHSTVEGGWREERATDFYDRITEDFHNLTIYLYKLLRDRPVTIVLQHWEGDWLVRGRGGELWNPPPKDWKRLCEQMQKWLAARQVGVSKARNEAKNAGAKCRVAHATEVNRVADLWNGIPTMTEHVLPGVELDLISYSSYDGLKDSTLLYRCIMEIKRRAKTTPLFGKNAVYIGEIGIPENEYPTGLAERWDKLIGAALAAEVSFIVHWQLYCNELNPKLNPRPKAPVTKADEVRGFWLVRPDGSLGEAGKYFQSLWQRG